MGSNPWSPAINSLVFIDDTVFDDDDKKFEGYWTKTPIPSESLSKR